MPDILIIEDEKAIRKTLSEILSFEGYKIDEAGDGEEGLKKFKRENLTFLNLKDSWKATLSASINGSIEVRNKGYLALSDLIKGFYTHIGETSNLILN